jgi:hypothetical protein
MNRTLFPFEVMMPAKQPKGCSNIYTKSAACYSTSKLDIKDTEDILNFSEPAQYIDFHNMLL